MPKLLQGRVYQVGLLLLVCAASAAAGLALRGGKASTSKSARSFQFQRSDEKVIESRPLPDDPFQLGDLSVKHMKLGFRQKFNAKAIAESADSQNDDWLENLSFTIKNKLDKSMTYINLHLEFPETGTVGPRMVYTFDLGTNPGVPDNIKKFSKPLRLPPNDVFTFSLSARELGAIKTFLSHGGFQLSNLNQAIVKVEYILFEDGMRWEQGHWYKANPNVLGGYEKISK